MSEKKIGEIGSKKNPVIVNLKTFKGNEMIDIRKYFTNKDGESLPTKKGISLTRRHLYPLFNLLGQSIDDINEYFDANIEEKEATERIEKIRLSESDIFNLNNHKFFEVHNYGSEYTVSYNKSHPLWKTLEDLSNKVKSDKPDLKDEILSIFNAFLIAYYKSTSHVNNEETVQAGDLLLEMEINWGSYLKRLLN